MEEEKVTEQTKKNGGVLSGLKLTPFFVGSILLWIWVVFFYELPEKEYYGGADYRWGPSDREIRDFLGKLSLWVLILDRILLYVLSHRKLLNLEYVLMILGATLIFTIVLGIGG